MGIPPRIWMKDLVVEKLRKNSKTGQLIGKAKITLADERALDKIVASTVVLLERVPDSDIVSGTIEIFFPAVTEERPASDVMERDSKGQVKIYHKRAFTARLVPPEDKPEPPKASSKKGKPVPVTPVI